MGIDYDGGMLVGCHGSSFKVSEDCPEEYLEGLEEGEYIEDLDDDELLDILGLEQYSQYCDADTYSSHVGFPVNDTPIDSVEFEGWLIEVKVLADRFEKITGVQAKLIGCQHIW